MRRNEVWTAAIVALLVGGSWSCSVLLDTEALQGGLPDSMAYDLTTDGGLDAPMDQGLDAPEPDQKVVDQKVVDQKVVDQKVADQSVDTPVADQSVDTPVADQTVDTPPQEQGAVDSSPDGLLDGSGADQ